MGRKCKGHLCWMCNKACNSTLCIWVRTLRKLPKGAKRDKNNNIIECPLFVHDGKIYTLEDKLKKLGFTRRQYNFAVEQIRKYNLDISALKYLIERRQYKSKIAKMSKSEYNRMIYLKNIKNKPIEVLGEDAFIDKKKYVKKLPKPKLTSKELRANKLGLTLDEYEEYIRELRLKQVSRMLELRKQKFDNKKQ